MTETNPLIDALRRGVSEAGISKTLMVSFPTQGQFYHDGVLAPGTNVNEITVNFLGTEAELILRDPIMMAAGRAIPKMISVLVPEVKIPEELSDIDIEVLLIAVRMVSHGVMLNLDHKCSNPAKHENSDKLICEEISTLPVNLVTHIQKFTPITDWTPYRIEFDLGNGEKQIVHLRRMPYRSVLNGVRNTLMTEQELEPFKDKTFDQLILSDETLDAYIKMNEMMSRNNIDAIMDMIVAVEMITGDPTTSKMVYTNDQPEHIKAWLWAIPGEWTGKINDRVIEFTRELAELNTVKYACPKCQYENSFQMQLDVNKLFFSKPQPTSPPEKASEPSPSPSKSKSRPRIRTSSR